MSVLKTLRDIVAPELNHLYTTPPVEIPGGLDCGWHGREHALHAFFVARMFGATAELCIGDYAILSRFLPPLTTLERETDHAWCTINGTAPVDLSMTFGLFAQSPQLRSPIIGEGRNGDWDVQYSEDESPMDESFSNRNEIIFVENEIVADPESSLLEDPVRFLTAPPAAEPASEAPRLDATLVAQITLHCFECASGRAKNTRHRLNRTDALSWIAANYPNPTERIRQRLGGGVTGDRKPDTGN